MSSYKYSKDNICAYVLYSDAGAYGVISRTEEEASPQTDLHKVRVHRSVEVSHYIIDWVFDEDRSIICTDFGPEYVTRLRRFAIGLIKSKGIKIVSKKMRQLSKKMRSVLDYLKITNNRTKSCSASTWLKNELTLMVLLRRFKNK